MMQGQDQMASINSMHSHTVLVMQWKGNERNKFNVFPPYISTENKYQIINKIAQRH